MRILVTGAQGCIGAWVVKNLLDRGLEVLIYDADPTPARLSLIAPAAQMRKAAMEIGRIEDGSHLKALVKDGGITHIVHLAAQLLGVLPGRLDGDRQALDLRPAGFDFAEQALEFLHVFLG